MAENRRRGKIYGVGVGPGDPELMTLRACRLIREHNRIAVPVTAEKSPCLSWDETNSDPRKSTAYQIAVRAVPELADKKITGVFMPMVHDPEKMHLQHKKAASRLMEIADTGEDVVYLTLGDPTIYCSFSYLQKILEENGYAVELVSAVTSFCASAAAAGVPLILGQEELRIVSGISEERLEKILSASDLTNKDIENLVVMKAGGNVRKTASLLKARGYEVLTAVNCGMEDGKIYRSSQELPERTDYFTLLIGKAHV